MSTARELILDTESTVGESERGASLACPSCDLVFDVSDLADGETARCSRCGHFLTRYRADELSRGMAFSVSGLILLVLACSFPFMEFKASGLQSLMTLPQAALELWRNGMPDLAFLVAAFIILIPAALLILIAILMGALMTQRQYAFLPTLGRLIFVLQNWSMVEVFFIGVLVSLVKIAGMATVVLDISFWAYAAFSILFTLALSNLDRFQCWRRIEASSRS
ncbi:MAG: paraquat-inducible protein A [Sedimenticolaceae bacterium]